MLKSMHTLLMIIVMSRYNIEGSSPLFLLATEACTPPYVLKLGWSMFFSSLVHLYCPCIEFVLMYDLLSIYHRWCVTCAWMKVNAFKSKVLHYLLQLILSFSPKVQISLILLTPKLCILFHRIRCYWPLVFFSQGKYKSTLSDWNWGNGLLCGFMVNLFKMWKESWLSVIIN